MSIERKIKIGFCILGFGFAVTQSRFTFAHGADEKAPAKKERSSEMKMIRSRSSAPRVIPYAELLKVLEKESGTPADIAVVRCSLHTYAVCRGLPVVLYDKAGTRLVIGNTGSEGIVAFEGLLDGQTYEVRIDSNKYRGIANITAGNTWSLNGDRIAE